MADQYPIGSIRIFEGRKLRVVEDAPLVADVCEGCCMASQDGRRCGLPPEPPLCSGREDGAFVHYEEVVEDDTTEEHYQC